MDRTGYLPDGTYFDFWEKQTVYEKQLHVDQKHPLADDQNDGSLGHPLLTIQEAANRATPGTQVLIHGGVYREWVRPAQGGLDAAHMISYEAFGDGEVTVKASEIVTDFSESRGWRIQRGPWGDGAMGNRGNAGYGSTVWIRSFFAATIRFAVSISCTTGFL